MPTSDIDTYYHELMVLLNQGGYFAFHREYVTVLGLSRHEALFLQDLINHYSMPNTVRDGTYFLCTTAYLEASLAWSKDTQKDLLKSLRTRGYISTLEKGMPKRRWVRINMQRILKDLKQKASNGREKPPTGRREKPPTMGGKSRHKELSIEERRREGGNPTASGGSDIPPPPSKSSLKESKGKQDEECRSGASHLRKALQDNSKQTKGRSAALWEEPLRLLRDKDRQKEWLKVLRWYCHQIPRQKELKLPRIANGKEFREQYGWIERIYDREMEEGGEMPPPKDEKRFCIYGNTRS